MRDLHELGRQLPVIKLHKSDLVFSSFAHSSIKAAKDFYTAWTKTDQTTRTSPCLGEIVVSRVGWRHITKRGRGLASIIQSFSLLGAAKQIIRKIDKPYQLRPPKVFIRSGIRHHYSFISVRSRVVFPNRQEAVVQVVVKRKQTINETNGHVDVTNWFYSVYEPRRGLKMQQGVEQTLL
jgi:hypothetical protein